MSNGKKPIAVVHRTNPSWDDEKIPWDDDKLINVAWGDAIGDDGLEDALWGTVKQKSYRVTLLKLLRTVTKGLLEGQQPKRGQLLGMWRIVEPNNGPREKWAAAKEAARAAAEAAATPPPPAVAPPLVAPPAAPAPTPGVAERELLVNAITIARSWGCTNGAIVRKVAQAFPTFPAPKDIRETDARKMWKWAWRAVEAWTAANTAALETFLAAHTRPGPRAYAELLAENAALKAKAPLTPGA